MKPKTVYTFDTEFWEDGERIHLISMGIVCDDGRELYLETENAGQLALQTPWLTENVYPHLERSARVIRNRPTFAAEVLDFTRYGKHMPEWWAYFADYDWIVMCQLYGRMVDLPRHWPQFCLDINQEAYRRGISRLKEAVPQEGTEHNALEDARWNWKVLQWLQMSE